MLNDISNLNVMTKDAYLTELDGKKKKDHHVHEPSGYRQLRTLFTPQVDFRAEKPPRSLS